MRLVAPMLCLVSALLLTACQPDSVPAQGVGGAKARNPAPPLPQPHPALARMTLVPFEVPSYGVAGEYPDHWRIPKYSPDPNVVFQLRINEDTYFDFGFLPGVRAQVAAALPDLAPAELADAILAESAQGVAASETYFRGTRKTLLDLSTVLFGTHEVLIVTLLIERPTGVLALMSPDELDSVMLSQQHYFDLAPEGSRRLTRQYVWLIGEDVWIAQLVAPPATFLQRTTEVEELILPSLEWGPRRSETPSPPVAE